MINNKIKDMGYVMWLYKDVHLRNPIASRKLVSIIWYIMITEIDSIMMLYKLVTLGSISKWLLKTVGIRIHLPINT